MDSKDLGRLYEHFLAGDAAAVAALFAGTPNIYTSMDGAIEGEAALAALVESSRDYLTGRNAGIEPVAGFDTPERSVAEIRIRIDGPDRPLPVAMVGERSGEQYSAIRVYYNVFMVEHCDMEWPPIVTPPEDTPDLPSEIAAYFGAVRDNPDPEAAAALFGDKGYLVAPTGHRRDGKRMIEQLFDLFLRLGGMHLRPCLVTTDGTNCAVEWMSERWGNKEFAPHCGVAVFEIASGGGDGRGSGESLAAARLYDDLKPPFLPDFRRKD